MQVCLPEFEEALGYERLGKGVAREGWDLGDGRVLKRAIPSDEAWPFWGDPREHNQREWQAWEHANAAMREWLAPALACAGDGSWLLVRKAEQVGKLRWQDVDRIEQAVGHVIRDLHDGNVGKVDGKLVVTDYGMVPIGGLERWAQAQPRLAHVEAAQAAPTPLRLRHTGGRVMGPLTFAGIRPHVPPTTFTGSFRETPARPEERESTRLCKHGNGPWCERCRAW